MFYGATQQACERAVGWSRNGNDTWQPTIFWVALEALEGSKTISQLSSECEIHAKLIRA